MKPQSSCMIAMVTLWGVSLSEAAPLLPGKKLGVDYGPTLTPRWNNFTNNGTLSAGSVVTLDGKVCDGVSMTVSSGQFFNNDGTNGWVGLASNPTDISPNLKAPEEFVESVVTDIAGNYSLGDGTPFKLTIQGLNPYYAYKIHVVSAAGQPPSSVGQIETTTVIGAVTYTPSSIPRSTAVNTGRYHVFEQVSPTAGGQLVLDAIDSSSTSNPVVNGVLIEAVEPNEAGLLDDDGDGLPNWWETAYGFLPGDPSDGGATDTDGDGFSNVDEYFEGADPRDPLSIPMPPEWALDGGSIWSFAGNWNPAIAPNGVNGVARLYASALVNAEEATIALDLPVTLGLLEAAGDKRFVLGGESPLTFQTTAPAAMLTADSTTGEVLRMEGDVVLASPLSVTAANAAVVSIQGSLYENGVQSLTKLGSGDLVLAGDLSGFSGEITLSAGRLLLQRSGGYVLSNPIQGGGSLVIGGGGEAVLQGPNTYSGGTTVRGGSSLEIASMAAVGSGLLTLDGGTLKPSASISASGRAVNVGDAGATIQVEGEETLLLTGGSAASTGTVLKTGAGTWQITGGNSGTLGEVTVAEGIMNLARNDSYGQNLPSQQSLRILAGGKVTNGSGAVGYNAFREVILEGGTLSVTNSLSASGGTFQAYGIKEYLKAAGDTPSQIIDEVEGNNGAINIGGAVHLGDRRGADLTVEVEDATGSEEADLTISAKLKNSADGSYQMLHTGLKKTGEGTLVLSAQNLYTGNTTVEAGTLSVKRPYLADEADVTVASGAVLDLDFEGTDVIDQLTLGGEGMAPGVYGAMGAEAPVIETPFLTGTGTLTVTTEPEVTDPFVRWMSENYPELGSPDNEPGADPDGDGMSNFEEFAFAGDPTSGMSRGLRRFAIESFDEARHFTLTLACRAGAVFGGSGPLEAEMGTMVYRVRGGEDLEHFLLGVEEVAAIAGDLPDPAPEGYEYRTFRLVEPVSARPKAFLQAEAEIPAE